MYLIILILIIIICLLSPIREYFSFPFTKKFYCSPLKKACKLITENPGMSCPLLDSEWEATCVAAVGGPEDLPGVAACSAAAFAVNQACTQAVKRGEKFDYSECNKALKC